MDVSEAFGHALSAGNLAAVPLVLMGGLIAGLNPCCLALYPAAATVCCSVGRPSGHRPTLGNAAAFVLGVAVAIAGLGCAAAYIGRIATLALPIKYGIAIVPVVMGVHQLGWLPVPLWTAKRFTSSVAGAFGTGALLSLVIGPCGTPVLASVLSFAAYKQSFVYGGLLLFIYGIGSAVPLMLVGTAAGEFLRSFEHSRPRWWLHILVGGSLILLGFYLLWRV